MYTETALLQALRASPGDELAWLALGDWLEETGQPQRAELLRLVLSLTRATDGPDRSARERRMRALLNAGIRPYMPTITLPIGMDMVLVPPGKFLMGSPTSEKGRYGNEGPQHPVAISSGFYLGACPVTQAQWRAVMGESPSKFIGDDLPVQNLTWLAAQDFCKRLSARLRQRFRLPTEAQWEYACRAGTTTVYHTGNTLNAMKKAGWCSYDGHFGSGKEPRPVGQFQPNGFGLYDMHGNVWEWCANRYAPYPGVIEEEAQRADQVVQRGGSWYTWAPGCRAAFRGSNRTHRSDSFFGCRVVLCLD